MEAYGKIVRRYQVRVYNLVLLMLRDPVAAEDVTQEALIKGFEKIHLFDFERRFLPWILKIATNKALDFLRSAKRRELAFSPQQLELTARVGSDIDEDMDRKRRLAKLEQAIAGLPMKYRLPLLLKHSEGLSYLEMEEVTGVSKDALKMRVSRARRKLREMMRQEEIEELG